MKLFLAVLLGIFASFGLTILAELVLFTGSIPKSARLFFPEFPAVTVTVGVLIGLIVRGKPQTAAALSLIPWTVWLVLATNGKHSSVSRWLITVVIVSIYSAIGVGASVLAARMARATSKTNVDV
jgi:hypothetical protein